MVEHRWVFFRPWNNALRGLDEDYNPDGGEALRLWASCLAVLFSAVVKLSCVPARDASGAEMSVRKVWRGMREEHLRLPASFVEQTEANQGYPGGTEMSFMSTTTDIWTAYTYSGGWDVPATILELEYDHATRGADLRFLSCMPRESELLLPPFTALSTKSIEQRGNKRFISCSLAMNPGTIDTSSFAMDDFAAVPPPSMYAGSGGGDDVISSALPPPLASGQSSSPFDMDTAALAALLIRRLRKKHPEFMDPFTGSVLSDPVRAEDGQIYERAHVERWIVERRSAHEPLVSPLTHEVMGASLSPQPELLAKIQMMRTVYMGALSEARSGSTEEDEATHADADAAISSIRELGELFEGLELLQRVLHNAGDLAATSEDWQVPCFIVLGSESSGKSSLLERLSMIPIFPRDVAICTRMPIKVQLRRTATPEPIELSVVDTRGRRIGSPVVIAAECGHVDVRETMRKVIQAEHGRLTGVSHTRMLNLQVRSNLVPTLDFIDLPGLVSVAATHEGEPEDMGTQTERLLSSMISLHKEHAIFLAVVLASQPPRNAPIMRMVQEHGIEAQTIGILTKCDEVSSAAIRSQVMPRLDGTAKDLVPLPLGWVVTMTAPIQTAEGSFSGASLRSSEGTSMESLDGPCASLGSSIDHLHEQARREAAWCEKHIVSVARAAGGDDETDLSSQCGCNRLVDKMKHSFNEYMRTKWAPLMIARLTAEEVRIERRQAELGMPPAHLPLVEQTASELRALAVAEAAKLIDGEQMAPSTWSALEQLKSPSLDRRVSLFSAARRTLTVQESVDRMMQHADATASAMQATHSALNEALITALRKDESAFKLGRFPQLIDTLARHLDDYAQLPPADYIALVLRGQLPSVTEVLQLAADEVDRCDGWNEAPAVALERRNLDQAKAQLPRCKDHIAQLLDVSVADLEALSEELFSHHLHERGSDRKVHAAVEIPAAARELHCGWMHKRGGVMRMTMQKRFFKMLQMPDERQLLVWFLSDGPRVAPSGHIDLSTVTGINRLKPDDASSFAFAINTSTPDKDRVLDPGSRLAWEAWETMLRAAMNHATQASDGSS